ncbi:hypothetical protein ACHAXT_000681 [Thalassiosira profunda]
MADPSAPSAAGDGPSSPAEAAAAARALWLEAASPSDLAEVERLYRHALSSKTSDDAPTSASDVANDCSEPAAKRRKSGHCGLTREQFVQAGEKLALLLCQSGRCRKAKKGLKSIGFTCRLAERVLCYPKEGEVGAASSASSGDKAASKKAPPCQIVDNFLSKCEVERLRSVFASPAADYWAAHEYSVEPPSPYFSYVLPLDDILSATDASTSRFGFIGDLARKIISCPIVQQKFPKLCNAKFVELWAHNRPHASGHQMHFDSDDEGRGGVRNPIVSTILYITAGDATTNNDANGNAAGGPSLVTNQKLSDNRLATKGWMAHPRPQRLVAFDGRYLHGVVPGKGVRAGRRATLMLAFWEKIQVRPGAGPGSARPFPASEDGPEWARRLVAPLDGDESCSYDSCAEVPPVELDVIYETLDGKPWKRGMGMPEYDQVFQGF